MLQQLRRVMIRPERDRIADTVEVDETYVGGLEEGRDGGRRRDSSKLIVVAAVEVRGRGTGRIGLGVVPDLSGPSLVGFVEAVAPGSTVRTDGWQGYVPLKQHGYDHRPTTQGGPKEAATSFPRVHRVFTHLNRRRTPMAAFQSLLGLGLTVSTALGAGRQNSCFYLSG